MMELKAIVEEAEAANVHVMAHAYTPRAIQNSVRAGVKSIEHGNSLDDESAQVMADVGAFLVPTLATYEALAREGAKEGLTPEMIQKVYDVLEAGKRSIGIAQNKGVTLCYGSDLLADMHRHQLRGLVLLEEAGLSVVDIILSATYHAARLFGMEGEIGIIAEGATADILVSRRIPSCQRVCLVKGGKITLSQF